MPKCDFNKVTTYGGLLLYYIISLGTRKWFKWNENLLKGAIEILKESKTLKRRELVKIAEKLKNAKWE